MAKAKKLPSGSWRVQVYSHKDPNGKRHYESFTASTKREAEMLAAQFAADNERKRAQDLTVEEAVRGYIEHNRPTLSPSTLRGYLAELKRMEPIYDLRIRKITTSDIQGFITCLCDKEYAPKTVKNTYGTLVSSLRFYDIDKNFKVKLPEIPENDDEAPESDAVMLLFQEASPNLKKAIMFAAFHSLRRSEICALKYKDLDGNVLHVHSSIVRGPEGWVHKPTPKTKKSARFIKLRDFELDLIGKGSPEEYIVPIKPSTINSCFTDLRKKHGLDNIRFHGLRAYYASILSALDIPEFYIRRNSGWTESSPVFKKHYQKRIISIEEKYTEKINDYFDELCNTKYNTEIKKNRPAQ